MEIQKLTVSERIQLAEALWDSVAEHDSEIALTIRQQQVLDERLKNYEVDGDTGSSWADVRRRIVNKK